MSQRQATVRNEENIAAVCHPILTITRRSHALGISNTNLCQILRKDFRLSTYEIPLTEELKRNNYLFSGGFSNWALEKLKDDPEFHKKIFFNDKTPLWLNCIVNWSENQPEAMRKKALHSPKSTI